MIKKTILLSLCMSFIIGLHSCDNLQKSRLFTVTYEVEGTFSECAVFYVTRSDQVEPEEINQGGQVIHEDVVLPWSHTFDVTVTPMYPFNTQIGAVCSDSAGGEIEVVLTVDGELEVTDRDSGQNVSALAEYRLEVR